jgi:hypothetical protein
MALTKTTYVKTELKWAEQQLKSWRAYVDANPMEHMEDRIKWKETKTGGAMPMVIASIESQGKFIQETMRNYLALLEVVDRLRKSEDESKKVSIRGDVTLGSQAEEFLKSRNK